MPLWLRSLMSRLDALDDHFANNPPASPSRSARPASPTDRQRQPGADAAQDCAPAAGTGVMAPPPTPSITLGSSSPQAAAGNAGPLDVPQQLSELRQLMKTLSQQVGLLTARVKRVEFQVASRPGSSDAAAAPAAAAMGTPTGLSEEQMQVSRDRRACLGIERDG